MGEEIHVTAKVRVIFFTVINIVLYTIAYRLYTSTSI